MRTLKSRGVTDEKPIWLKDLRDLRFRGRLVKRFRQPAGLQEPLLDRFQAAKWKTVIDSEIHDPERLHNAVLRLNLHQKETRIVFERIGDSRHVLWRPGKEET